MIPAEAVEAAARALWARSFPWMTWDEASRLPGWEAATQGVRQEAISTIEAVSEYLLPAAWDRGYRSGFSNAMRRMSDEPHAPSTHNPYKPGT